MEDNKDFRLAFDTLDIFNMDSMVFTTPKTNYDYIIWKYMCFFKMLLAHY